MKASMEPTKYTGRAKEQTEEFIAIIQPIIEKNKDMLGFKAEIKV
ncbi:MAG TPA: hypothetical protein VJZ06_04590 [Mobilitalea sp.]|nr:hypothetical protein [Mobilitalea sp.]